MRSKLWFLVALVASLIAIANTRFTLARAESSNEAADPVAWLADFTALSAASSETRISVTLKIDGKETVSRQLMTTAALQAELHSAVMKPGQQVEADFTMYKLDAKLQTTTYVTMAYYRGEVLPRDVAMAN